MRSAIRRGAGMLLALAVALALGALSRVPYGSPSEEGVLRLSWRLRGERVSECRPLTQAEREALPIHMRREEVCEGRMLPYRMRLWVAGELTEDRTVVPAGAREDRPLFLFHEVRLPAGPYAVAVRFEAVRPAGAAFADEQAPGALTLEEGVRLEPGRVALITYDADRRALILLPASARSVSD